MNKMKKILSLVLVVMLFASLVVSASAETITISNPIAGKTYNAYKVFDAEVDSAGNWKYTIKDDAAHPFFSVVYDGTKSKIEGLVITGPDADGKYDVVRPEGSTFSAASFAETLMTALKANPTAFATAASGASPLTVADKGYYLVATYDGSTSKFEALAELTTAQDITIQDKNDNIFEKEADKVNVELGEDVNFTLTGKVPSNIADFNNAKNTDKTFTYYVADKMTKGLTFDPASVVVTVGGNPVSLTPITDAARQMKDADLYRVGLNGYTFELCLDLLKDDGQPRFAADSVIKITYKAKVNEDAVTKLSNNKATLTYSDDPNDTTSFGQQTPDVDLYSSRILIDKYETGQESHKLKDAKFVLANDAGTAYYKLDTATKAVEWVTDITQANVFTTDDNGAAEIKGLKDGTYKLIETEAPSGYTKIADPVDVIIDGSSATTVGYNDAQIVTALTNTASIANTPGSLLPSTGGIGTTIFYVLGGLLAAGAVIFLVSKKKAGEEA